ncbi:hypothetical protein RND81_07G097600 [Saponaria officinalis]|uniref:Uncharacterized protein n=1 Tax=Saponaria officinalis TaxID=3572 RepID=A0AAW1JQV4_SAPOF
MLNVGLLHANNGGSLVESSQDALTFFKSLKELKDLRSQIHEAADYCERSFLNSEDKANVLDNTREYLCRAVVTVVDHLGCVSANLNRRIENTDRVAETELQINCLKQKLDSCDQYNHNFTLTRTRWSADFPRYYSRYISPPSNSSRNEVSLLLRANTHPNETSKYEFKADEDMPLFMYTSPKKICFDFNPKSPLDPEVKDLKIMPVNDGLLVAPKLIRNPSFHFQVNLLRI